MTDLPLREFISVFFGGGGEYIFGMKIKSPSNLLYDILISELQVSAEVKVFHHES